MYFFFNKTGNQFLFQHPHPFRIVIPFLFYNFKVSHFLTKRPDNYLRYASNRFVGIYNFRTYKLTCTGATKLAEKVQILQRTCKLRGLSVVFFLYILMIYLQCLNASTNGLYFTTHNFKNEQICFLLFFCLSFCSFFSFRF